MVAQKQVRTRRVNSVILSVYGTCLDRCLIANFKPIFQTDLFFFIRVQRVLSYHLYKYHGMIGIHLGLRFICSGSGSGPATLEKNEDVHPHALI